MHVATIPISGIPSRIGKYIINRERLRVLAARLPEARLTHVHAPAGFGKTTLLRQWYEALQGGDTIVAWLNANRHERDIVRQIVMLLSPLMPELGALLDKTDGFRTTDLEVQALLKAATASERSLIIFIDEAELLREESAVLLLRLIDWLPQNISFVCASRGRLPFPISRLQALGEVVELGPEVLRFTVDETRDAALATGLRDLQSPELEGLHRRTEGWATGLKLALLAMRGESDTARLIASFSGHKALVADYFSETVFSQQSEELQDFLMCTAVFEKFDAPMCDAILETTGSRDLVAQVENAGLFLIPLDDERKNYRYHGLFASFLRRRLVDLQPGRVRELHLAASRRFAESGDDHLAVDHAMQSGDLHWLAELLNGVCEQMTYRGGMTGIEALAENLPQEVLALWPRLLMVVAWAQLRRMHFDTAARTLDIALQRIADLEAGGADPSDIAQLRFTHCHRQMMLEAAQDNWQRVLELTAHLQREDPDCHPYLACTIYGQSMRALREQFRFAEVEKLQSKARGGLEKSGYKFAYVAFQAIIGPTLDAIGRTAAAKQALEHGLLQAVSFAGENSGLGALPALPLAELAYDRNEIETARSMIFGYLSKARLYGFSDELSSGYVTAAKLCALDGEVTAALGMLDEANSVALECGADRLRVFATAERVRLLLRAGHIERAMQIAESVLPKLEVEPNPHAACTTVEEMTAILWVRTAMVQGRYKESLAMAQRWRQFMIHRGALRSQLRWNLLCAQSRVIMGDRRAAQRHLREALLVGAENELVRPFVDEGPVIGELLYEAYAETPTTSHPAEHFARKLLLEFGAQSPAKAEAGGDIADAIGLDGRITEREIEILNFVAAGLRNREIGMRLGLTEGSVKWYMQQIYDKVGTRRRTVAVERARQFGLLA